MGFSEWAAENGAQPKGPRLAPWLRANPEIADQLLKAQDDGFDADALVAYVGSLGVETSRESLRKRLSDYRRDR